MARTPLLASVRRLLREHDLAHRAALPVEEIRERSQNSNLISRRDFIAGVAAATAPAMLPSVLKGTGWATAPRIPIIGGGIAGLTAALGPGRCRCTGLDLRCRAKNRRPDLNRPTG